MTPKLWGGILLGVFVAAVGAELLKRKCPRLAKEMADCTNKIVDSASKKIKSFAVSSKDAFKNGYASTKTELSKS